MNSSFGPVHHTSKLGEGRRRFTSPVVELTDIEEDDGVDEAEFFVDQNSHDLQCRGQERRHAGIDGSQLLLPNHYGQGPVRRLPPEMKIKAPFPPTQTYSSETEKSRIPVWYINHLMDLHGCRLYWWNFDITLLFSKLSMAGMILDFCEAKTNVFWRIRNMMETTIGHQIIRVLPEGVKAIIQSDLVKLFILFTSTLILLLLQIMNAIELKSQLECPICYTIPSCNVLVCINGHRICLKCFSSLGVKRCPQSRCAFDDPPRRNRDLESIIERGDWVRACPWPGCPAELEKNDLLAHQETCERHPGRSRDAVCPFSNCQKLLAIGDLDNHLRSRHNENYMTSATSKYQIKISKRAIDSANYDRKKVKRYLFISILIISPV